MHTGLEVTSKSDTLPAYFGSSRSVADLPNPNASPNVSKIELDQVLINEWPERGEMAEKIRFAQVCVIGTADFCRI
jgi:hypothetical protein